MKERMCLECGYPFKPTKDKQLFCSRKCFKKNYHIKKRNEFRGVFPKMICQKCQLQTEFHYDPFKESRLFDLHKCPFCTADKLIIEILEIDGDDPIIIF